MKRHHEKITSSTFSTNLLPIVVAECRLLGRGIILWIAGLDHVIVSGEPSRKQNQSKMSLQKMNI